MDVKEKIIGGLQPAQVWRDSFIDDARHAVLSGCTSNKKLGCYFGVTHTTMLKWRKKYPPFDVAIRHANRALLNLVTNQMLISATEHKITEEKVLSDGSIVQYQKTLPGNVRAQETLARVLGEAIMDDGDNSWDPKAKIQVSGSEENPLAFIMGEVSKEAERAGPLPSQQPNFRYDD